MQLCDSLIVCERTTPIARLVPFGPDDEGIKISDSLKPVGALSEIRAVRLRKKVDVDKVLLETRGDQ